MGSYIDLFFIYISVLFSLFFGRGGLVLVVSRVFFRFCFVCYLRKVGLGLFFLFFNEEVRGLRGRVLFRVIEVNK